MERETGCRQGLGAPQPPFDTEHGYGYGWHSRIAGGDLRRGTSDKEDRLAGESA